MNNPRNILLYAVQGIGNTLMLTPAARLLKKTFPRARVTAIVSGYGQMVLANNPNVDELVNIEKARSIAGIASLILSLRRKKFDIGIIAYPNISIMPSLMLFLMGVKVRIGHEYFVMGLKSSMFLSKATPIQQRHDIESNFDLIRDLIAGNARKDPHMFMPITRDQKAFAIRVMRNKNKVAGFHLGGDLAAKRWPIDFFADVANYLIDRYNADILVVGSEAENELALKLQKIIRKKPIIMAGKTSLGETAALISKCKLFITNDSGPMHMASALGIPVIALFGPTSSVRSRPIGKNCIIMEDNKSCDGCRNRDSYGISITDRHTCMQNITPREVAKASDRLLT